MDIDKKSIACLKILGMDTINRAESGHPGIVLGAAPILYALYKDHMIANPEDPLWINRDRFVLSAGHGSALLYSLLHLSGYKITLNDLKNFRSIGNTPGHPEYRETDGVDCTTGPLGQGIAMAVGMAMAEANLAARYNRPDFSVFNHFTYCLCGDGCLQEGISQEAISLAGHLKLKKLILLYDSNNVQLDSRTSSTVSDNVKLRFQAVGWNYLLVKDGANYQKISKAISKAKLANKPTVIEIKTIIGAGTTNEDTNKVHGAPISDEELNRLRIKLGYNHEKFHVASDIYTNFKESFGQRGQVYAKNYGYMMEKYAIKFSSLHTELINAINGKINFKLSEYTKLFKDQKNLASRISCGIILSKLTSDNNLLIGGSADLSSSTKVKCMAEDFTAKSYDGRNILFGVREHAMAAVCNGLTLHGGLRAFCGGFFVFSDYMKPAIRLSALMKLPVIYFFTHDSVHVGQDGPTHQPIEQLISLRSIPNLVSFKPADTNELLGSFDCLKDIKLPSAVILTRQNLPDLPHSSQTEVRYGGYIIDREQKKTDLILVASGAEVNMCLLAKEELVKSGIDVRVVSVPSLELFKVQTEVYRKSVIPKNEKTIAVEAGVGSNWFEFAKHVFDIRQFGYSDTPENVLKKLNFTTLDLVKFAKKIVSKK